LSILNKKYIIPNIYFNKIKVGKGRVMK